MQPDYPLNREDWEVIALKDKDTVVGVAPAGSDDDDLVFVTRQAQLLRFSASAVRPQGRTAGGMAGIKLAAGDRVMFFGTASPADAAAVVVTIAGTEGALPGTAPGAAKVTALSEYPAKGRATAGVRAHRFLKGEDTLLLALGRPRPGQGVLPGRRGPLPPRRAWPPRRLRHSAVPGHRRDWPEHGVVRGPGSRQRHVGPWTNETRPPALSRSGRDSWIRRCLRRSQSRKPCPHPVGRR